MNAISQRDRKRTLLLRSIVQQLPPFCADFFRAIEPETSALTRLSYAYDLRLFFSYACRAIPALEGKNPTALAASDMDSLTPTDIEKYLEYMALYDKNELLPPDTETTKSGIAANLVSNGACGRERKLSSLRSLYRYLYRRELIRADIAELVDLPKKREKEIVRLEPDEVARLLDQADQAERLTKTQKRYHAKTRLRDVALLTLLLGTGIRVSECVGLDLEDIDFRNNAFRITRKGGNRVVLYFSDEVADALMRYLNEERSEFQPVPGHETALFLSLQKRRMDARSVENLVKKYAALVTPMKKITPHKLRSTYGTALYRETGDIYLVADVLGHSDVNTTRKHYAAQSDENRRKAAKAVILRDDPVSDE